MSEMRLPGLRGLKRYNYKSPETAENFMGLIHHFTAVTLTFALPKEMVLWSPKKYKMANHKATKKDVRQATKRRERNRFYGKTTRNAVRDLRAATTADATKKLPEVISMIDKLAKRGIIHKNKAANLKSKLTKKSVTTK